MPSCKTLSHPRQIKLQAKDRLEKELFVHSNKEKVEFNNKMERINDPVIIEKLCNVAGKEPSEENPKHFKLEYFAKQRLVTLLQLKAFIWAHKPKEIKLKNQLPQNKETLVKALNGERNAILVAFQLQEKQSPLHVVTECVAHIKINKNVN